MTDTEYAIRNIHNGRPSNTELMLALILEAKSKALMQEHLEQVLDIIRS
jgi:phosphomannomutase